MYNPKNRNQKNRGRGKLALVFGREVDGLTDEEVNLCDAACRIPTGRLIESLSVSHAAVIILSQYYQHRTAGATGGGPRLSELPVMALPYRFADGAGSHTWCYGLLPDLPAVETSEAVRVVNVWYKMLAVEQKPRDDMTDQQLRDLEAIVPAGMKPVLQYFVVTFANSATRRALKITLPASVPS